MIVCLGTLLAMTILRDFLSMAPDSESVVHFRLVGAPASGKIMFLISLMHHLNTIW
jgi:hypothetical protein